LRGDEDPLAKKRVVAAVRDKIEGAGGGGHRESSWTGDATVTSVSENRTLVVRVFVGGVTLHSRLGQGKAVQCDSIRKTAFRGEPVDSAIGLHSKRAATRSIVIWKHRDPAVVDALWLRRRDSIR
jgi:hypothetical protein